MFVDQLLFSSFSVFAKTHREEKVIPAFLDIAGTQVNNNNNNMVWNGRWRRLFIFGGSCSFSLSEAL